jgi:hypothetical protein
MAIDRIGTMSWGSFKNRKRRSVLRKSSQKRGLLLEKLEDRMLLAVLGPKLAGIQPNDGELLALRNVDEDGPAQISIRNIAPQSLTFRFDEQQEIDPATLGGIRIVRSGFDGEFGNGNDVTIVPGYIGVGQDPQQNEVIVRFAETLPDDLYRIQLFGIDEPSQGIVALRNTSGDALAGTTVEHAEGGTDLEIDFALNLGPQVVAVVPQPIVRITDPANPLLSTLQQQRNQIVVYFNDDDLFVENDALGNPTQRSAENPKFYRLIHTRDTVDNTDDVTFFPDRVVYNPVTDTAVLYFERELADRLNAEGRVDSALRGDPIDDLGQIIDPATDEPIGSATLRLRVGTDEGLPAPPIDVTPEVQVTEDFGGVLVDFAATGDFGRAVQIDFTQANLGAGVLPSVSVLDNRIRVVLNTVGTSVQNLIDAIAGDAAAEALVTVSDASGDPANSVLAAAGRRVRVAGFGSSFETASDLGVLTSQSLFIASSIDPQPFLLDLIGSPDEPGRRELPPGVGTAFDAPVNTQFGADSTAGITTILYNFKQNYGNDAAGNPLSNLITQTQRQRVREAVELWGAQIGVQFLETADQGLTFATGDMNALNPNDPSVLTVANQYRVRVDPAFANGIVIMSSQQQWSDLFGGNWFRGAMTGLGFMLGLGRVPDLPASNLMSLQSAGIESVFPGNADILHGQFVHRPDSNDIDLLRFTIDLGDQQLTQKKTGLFEAETFAERLANSSELDTVLSLYREDAILDRDGNPVGFERQLIARNDDYFSSDSFLSMELGTGTYFIGVTSRGNTEFNPLLEDTGFGGTSQGKYEMRLNFRPQVDDESAITDLDRIEAGRPGTRLDGDADGRPGGVFNFWFQIRPQQRVIEVTGDSNTYVEGQLLTIEDSFGNVRRFEFDTNGALLNPGAIPIDFSDGPDAEQTATRLANAITAAGLVNVFVTPVDNKITLAGERVAVLSVNTVGVALRGKTIFVDKTSGANLNGTLAKPFDNIAAAFAAAAPGDIVRIVGNGGADGDIATIRDNFAYEIGQGTAGGPQILPDGTTMNVPRGVTAMIEAGAIFKLRQARIGVGSSSAGVDRSGASIQVLGTPHLLTNQGALLRDAAGNVVLGHVYFTSWLDETTGRDTHPPTTNGSPGDWGGISIRADVDRAEGRFHYEDEGVFLNYLNFADIRFGGGQVTVDTVNQTINPIFLAETRPTISYNTLSRNATAAISADPNSFEETNFHSPRFQLISPFTSDYVRVGPQIHGNRLINNSLNGLFIRIATPAGGELKTLTVPGRFDDTDIVHILAENLKIQGQPGEALLEESRPSVDLVTATVDSTAVGSFPSGDYNYKLVFVDSNGFEGRPSEATIDVSVAVPNRSVRLDSLPPIAGNFVTRRLYRSSPGGVAPYRFVADLDAVATTFVDDGSITGGVLRRDPPSVLATTAAANPVVANGAPGVAPGTYDYRVVFVDAAGNEGPASDATVQVTAGTAATGMVIEIDLADLPAAPPGSVARIYRSSLGGGDPYVLAGEIPSGATEFTDDGTLMLDADGNPDVMDPRLKGVVRARLDARLKIDPGIVVKLEGARIEAMFGSQIIAEGVDGQEVIFTSTLDDRYGAGGTFDTNNDGIFGSVPTARGPSRGDWAGLYIGHLGQLSLDHAYVAYGGGNDSKIEGTFKGFNVIELHQATARITHSIIEQNDPGTGGQGPDHRFGRGQNAATTIFIRGGQPIIAHNIIRHNTDRALTIHADSFTDTRVPDSGRITGSVDLMEEYRDNFGPLIRGNRIADNGPETGGGNIGYNGMEIRSGITLSVRSIWDDTDIVHVLFGEIRVPNFHSSGGLRLQSSPNASLVVKMLGGNAGFTATGSQTGIDDRIGGVLHVVGQPGFPVVLTSLHDDTVGAGSRPDGTPQTDTNNNGIGSEPSPEDWRSVLLNQFSHDRNVEIVLELEALSETAPGFNGSLNTAQFLGALAGSESSSSGSHRLGFEIHGYLNEPADVDYYSFTGVAGTEIWLDIDRTTYGVDTVIDVLDADGRLIAQSSDSLRETRDPSLLYNLPDAIPAHRVNPLQKSPDQYQPRHASGIPKDIFGTNPLDAGMRIVLPGATGERSPYIVRVRSSSLGLDGQPSDLQNPAKVGDGLTGGAYQLQIRMRELDEVPGSTVRYADIRYAENGIQVIGLPKHSPLVGEAAEDEGASAFFASNDSFFIDPDGPPGRQPQRLGNLFTSDRAVLSIAGGLSSSLDVDFYRFDVQYGGVGASASQHAWLTLDMDYASGLASADTNVVVFDSTGRPVLIGRDSNISDDRSAPVVDQTSDPSGMFDLSRGSAGSLDPFIGTAALPVGTYYVAVTSSRLLPEDLLNNRHTRLEPVNSTVRIAEDRIGSYGGSTAQPPVMLQLLDPTFVGVGGNLWHVSTRHATVPGHGLNPSFDGSRLDVPAGTIAENEPNNSIGTAQPLEGRVWSLNFDARIGDATNNTSQTIPHLTVSGTGDGTFDYYSFIVPAAGSQAIFDIDDGYLEASGLPGPGSMDASLFLYDAAGQSDRQQRQRFSKRRQLAESRPPRSRHHPHVCPAGIVHHRGRGNAGQRRTGGHHRHCAQYRQYVYAACFGREPCGDQHGGGGRADLLFRQFGHRELRGHDQRRKPDLQSVQPAELFGARQADAVLQLLPGLCRHRLLPRVCRSGGRPGNAGRLEQCGRDSTRDRAVAQSGRVVAVADRIGPLRRARQPAHPVRGSGVAEHHPRRFAHRRPDHRLCRTRRDDHVSDRDARHGPHDPGTDVRPASRLQRVGRGARWRIPIGNPHFHGLRPVQQLGGPGFDPERDL